MTYLFSNLLYMLLSLHQSDFQILLIYLYTNLPSDVHTARYLNP